MQIGNTLIAAIFLSLAPIQAVKVFHEYDTNMVTVPVRYINTQHIRVAGDGAVVVSEDKWFTPKAPVPYAEFWNCRYRQTAQQCVAIESMLQGELPGYTWQRLHPVFPDDPGK